MRRLSHLLTPAGIRAVCYFGDTNGRGYPGAKVLWRWLFNFRRSMHHLSQGRPRSGQGGALNSLRRDGILVQAFDEVFDKTAQACAGRIREICDEKMANPYIRDVVTGKQTTGKKKDFILELLDGTFYVESPFIQLAVNPRLLSLVNAYLGMASYLRDVQVWLNYPTPGPPKETQLWHRDYADFLNVKVFLYLNDVTRHNGPFCFVPQTHRIGARRQVPVRNARARIDDQEMDAAIPSSQWRICEGPSGTVVLCDTGGFHRGLKPVDNHRVLLELHYTSGKPAYPRTFTLDTSSAALNGLDATQKQALLL